MGWPGLSKKSHYFDGERSLCGKWLFFGVLEDAKADINSPDDCAACRKKYDKTYKGRV